MADPGHKRTDKELEALEKRLNEVYTQSAKEMQKKLDDYFRRFQYKDEQWRQWLYDGEVTEEEYKKWRVGQMAMGKRWEKMRDRLVSDQMHTNQIAREITEGKMPSIFELNANYAIYQVEHDAQIDTSLTLYNREAVDMILRDDPDLLLPPGRKVSKAIEDGKAKRWEKQKIQSVMLQGILQGESIPKLAARLASEVNDSDHKAAVRNARTMATNAQNAGRYDAYNRLEKNGVELTLEWAATLDNRTRHSHRMMHGQRRNVGEPFEVDGVKIMYPAQTGTFMGVQESDIPQEMIWNCFTGDNMVDVDSQIVKSYKHEYSGELITIETASGINFTCTPNHPILTRFGWIPAAELHKGDDLLVTSTVNDGSVRRDRDVDHVHASFEAVHESLSNLGRVDQRPMTDFNFHGDVPTSDVEVVSKERLLRGCIDTGISQGFYESVLKNANPLVFSKRHLVAGFRRVHISALRFVCRRRKALSLFWRRVCHSDVHRFGAPANGDVVLTEYAINDLPAETVIRSQLLNGLTGRVFCDNIVGVYKGFSTCHVYNLQTESGYYFAGSSINGSGEKYNGNMAIVKNCRCTILAWVKGFEHDTIKQSDKMGDMTFEEWLEAKDQPQDILHQYETGNDIMNDYIRKYAFPGEPEDGGEPGGGHSDGSPAPVDGRDITETWERRPDKFDFEIDDVLDAQGFDGKPRVVNREEFDRAVKESRFVAQRAYSAPDQETLDAYRDQLYNGKWYVDCSTGGSRHGQGMYCVADYDGKITEGMQNEANSYADYYGKRPSYIETLTVDPSAKFIDEDKVRNMMSDYNESVRAKAYNAALEETLRQDVVAETIEKYKKYYGVQLSEEEMSVYMKGVQLKNMESDDFTGTLKKQTNQIIKKYKLKDHSLVQSKYRTTDAYKKASQKEYSDIGPFAAANGYDGIKTSGREDQVPYIAILNRTKVIFLKGE